MIKFWGAKVLYNVIDRAIQVHGSLGYTTDLPLESMYRHARAARIYDGPDEVHKVTVARQVLKSYRASEPVDRARPDPPGRGDREVRRPPRRRHAEQLTRSSTLWQPERGAYATRSSCGAYGQWIGDGEPAGPAIGCSSAPVKPSGSSACWPRA